MRVGSLVKKVGTVIIDGAVRSPRDGAIGIVTEIHVVDKHVKVSWPHSYGSFWTRKEALEVISESR